MYLCCQIALNSFQLMFVFARMNKSLFSWHPIILFTIQFILMESFRVGFKRNLRNTIQLVLLSITISLVCKLCILCSIMWVAFDVFIRNRIEVIIYFVPKIELEMLIKYHLKDVIFLNVFIEILNHIMCFFIISTYYNNFNYSLIYLSIISWNRVALQLVKKCVAIYWKSIKISTMIIMMNIDSLPLCIKFHKSWWRDRSLANSNSISSWDFW